MIALISLLIVILFSIIVIRIGSVALEMTGLSREAAAFQAQSAFSGAGFTTSESEYVVSHPVRRKIIRLLIFIGNAGVVSAIATLVLTFIGQSKEEATLRLFWLFIGLLALYLFARSKLVDRGLRWIIKRGLEKFTSLKVYDYEQLLGLSKGYCIGEFKVRKGSWLENKKLRELKLDEEGVIVLAVYRKEGKDEKFIGAPHGELIIKKDDLLICYGPQEAIKQLSQRIKGRKGNMEHRKAVEEEKKRREEEKAMLSS
ncbi:MAG: TrkA C-terminal domain-containing protein [Thermoplasmata archaeon]|nr:TrkA C-terminal domain-containing protein [Thermoplasmata archaeon]